MNMLSIDHPHLAPRRPPWCPEHEYAAVPECPACAMRGLPAPHFALRMDSPRTVDDLRTLWNAWFERMGPKEFEGWKAAFAAYWKAVATSEGETAAVGAASAAYFEWEDEAGGDVYHHLGGGIRDRS